ncbi:MAG TPA: DUF4236 domain-containing protein [Streptosporangiaceae bacterium]
MSFKIAPGVRVRASTRGIGTSIGPRAARVHVGSRGIGVSSGVGPFTASANSHGRSNGGARVSRTSLSALERQVRQAQRAQEIADVGRMERALVTLHLREFPPTQRPIVPPPVPMDARPIARAMKRDQLQGISVFDRKRRRDAKALARTRTEQEVGRQEQLRRAEHARRQSGADTWWHALNRHDTDTVMAVIEAAYEDNEFPAACVDVGEGRSRYATVLVMFGPPSLVPERKADLTPTGRPTLKTRTKTERNSLYAAALGSTVIATVKEGFAVAPSVQEIQLLALRKDSAAATAADYVTAIYAARFSRERFRNTDWSRVDPIALLLTAPDALIKRKGSAREVVPIDLANEPGLQALVEHVRKAL